ncbi:MAG: Rad52/Rad22 family DNA repair protein [Acidobacteriota bacterium]|nr:Rad52/Rad22 family DNA repair protein [Acidobacteriota bacterium]
MEAVAEKNTTEKRDKRAKSIAAMGLVNREGDKFSVSTPSLRGRQTVYDVWRDAEGKIRCNCLEFEEASANDSGFRCEHILAVKYALVAKNTEPVTKQADKKAMTEIAVTSQPVSADKNEKSTTESHESTRGEQKIEEVTADVSIVGLIETSEAEPNQLISTKGDKQMNHETLKQVPMTAQKTADTKAETANNVINFTSTLKELRKNVEPHLVKQREGWRDRNGNTHYVDYVEWHTVADILDETAPNWSHTIRDIKQIGDIFTVTVAITIDGVSREGIGTGSAESELGIKKAEHDALKRAAVKFGIARELYKKESDVIEREGAIAPQPDGGFPANPIARSLSDLVTAKQLGMIRAIAREMSIDADEESNNVMQCKTDELSKKAASSFIQHLQDLQKSQHSENVAPMRRAG